MINVVVNTAMMGWGMYLGSRRELVWTLRQRAARAEAEQELRVSQARGTERERIAREMHDVLAHRITQMSMHSGALAFREDLAADELRDGLGQIQGKSNEAIARAARRARRAARRAAASPSTSRSRATPTSRTWSPRPAGTACTSSTPTASTSAASRCPTPSGRALYRIVQEGLTNATKHAPGAHVGVEVGGDPEHGLDVVVRNPLGFHAAGAAPGPAWGSSAWPSAPSCAAAASSTAARARRSCCAASIPWTA